MSEPNNNAFSAANSNSSTKEQTNQVDKAPKQEDSIKELKLKLKALTQCLIDERNKNTEIVERLKELENAVESTSGEIDNLTKERYELQSELSRIRSSQEDGDKKVKDVVNKLFNRDKINFDKFDEVTEAIEILKYENKKVQQKYLETKETYDQQKIKFATIMQVEAQKTIDFQQKVEKCKKEIESFSKQKGVKEGLQKEYNENFEKFKSECQKINDEKKKIETELEELKKQGVNARGKIDISEGTLTDLRQQIYQQNLIIDSLKDKAKPKQLETIVFTAESVEGMFLNSDDSRSRVIRFFKEEDRKEIIIEIGGRPFNITETKLIQNKTSSKKIQIEITNGFKPIITLDELIIDYFQHVYEEYLEQANSKEN